MIAIILILAAMVYVFMTHRAFKRRLERVERALADLRQGAQPGPPPAPASRTAPPEPTPEPAPETPPSGPWQAAKGPADAVVAQTPPAPAAPPSSAAEPPTAEPETPAAFVFSRDRSAALSLWLRENWVLAVAAASLTLAGVFLVQYGVEHGLLTPFWRVISALGFGGALIAGGEVIRRSHGDFGGATRFLPSTLSGAGIVVLFAGILSARVLYDLIGPGTTLAGLCAVSALAVVFGWFYGPVLAAIGILGGTAAPFLVGGESDAPWLFHYYFALIALAGLAVDTVRRWAWVSAVALIATFAAMTLLYLGDGEMRHFLAAVLIVGFGALTIPERRLFPRHAGPTVLGLLRARKPALPGFPARLAFGAIAFATLATFWTAYQADTAAEVWLGFGVLTLLLLAATLWLVRAPALSDHALLPGLALLALAAVEALDRGPLFKAFLAALVTDPEAMPPETGWIVFTIAALGVAGSLMAFRRLVGATPAEGPAATLWALAAAVFAPAMVLILEFLWQPARVTGAYPWALVAIAIAALMALLAERAARRAAADRLLHAALFAIAALTLIALALFLVLSETALTLALALMILLTGLLDRRFGLPLLGLFVQLGMAVIAYRLVIDPGVFWAIEIAPAWEVALAYLGPIALVAVAWALTDRARRGATRVVLESGLWLLAAVFVAVVLARLIDDRDYDSHWAMGLFAALWLGSALVQLYRLRQPGLPLRWLRWTLAGLFGLLGFALLAAQFAFANPLDRASQAVIGPYLFDSLALGYLSVAAVLAIGAWKLDRARRGVRVVLAALAGLYAATYAGFEIRRLWRGDDLSVAGVTDPELYSYTLALLVASLGLLIVAFARRSVGLRKLAMAGVGLTIAKVFLIDMAGLSGLIRVFSFMGLGLSLVGLAWLNRKMSAQWNRAGPRPEDTREPPEDGD